MLNGFCVSLHECTYIAVPALHVVFVVVCYILIIQLPKQYNT